jgi:AcrR family transcriptional regulator
VDCKRTRGRPKDESLHERRREEILEKATAVFAKHGYPNTDVQFVADPLRISKGTVYRYFPSKEQLFLAAVERGVRRLDQVMHEVIHAEVDSLDRLTAATRAYLEFFEKNPGLVELFIQERAEFRDRRKPIYFEHGCEDECAFKDLLEDLIAAGRVRKMPVERIMNVMGDLVYGTVLTNHMAGRKTSFEEQAGEIMDIVFNGILSDGERGGVGGRPRRGANGRRH